MKTLQTRILLSLFILSGFTSLVYQSVWIRVLSWAVGSTTESMSLVLSIFFLGLAGGSALAGRYIHRVGNPVRMYGLLEGFIGFYAFVLVYVLFGLQDLVAILPTWANYGFTGTLLKFLMVALLLAPPTLCMGASLPFLIRIFVVQDSQMSRWIPFLYGINTIGAAGASFATGFELIPRFGILWSNHLAALLNIAILGIAYWASSKDSLWTHASLQRKEMSAKPLSLDKNARLVLAATFVTGFTSIAAEVAWGKYLGIFLGTNIYGLALVLGLYLTGIALGSMLLSVIVPFFQNLQRLFLCLFLLVAIATLVSSPLLNLAPALSSALSYQYSNVISLIFSKSVFAGITLFLPTFIYGALFPLMIRLLSTSVEDAPRLTGLAYAINTVGSVLGSGLVGLLLIPKIGSANVIFLVTGLLCLFTLLICILRWKEEQSFGFRRVTVIAAIIITVLAPWTARLDYRNIIKTAQIQWVDPEKGFLELVKHFYQSAEEFKLIVEGRTGIISLSHDPQDGPQNRDYLRLKTNGLNESVYTLRNLNVLPRYEALLSLLPLLFSQNAEKAFVVGFGAGYSVQLLAESLLQNVFVTELEKGIMQASEFVYRGSHPVLNQSKVQLTIDDARFTLTSRKFGTMDIILSQPSHPWLPGAANLFTQEFFQIVKDNLSPQGLFSQWVNLYNMNEETLRSILKTFFTEFPHGAVFTNGEDQELIMLGSLAPLRFNVQMAEQFLQNPRILEMTTWVPFKSIADILSSYSMSREEVLSLTSNDPFNTDINAFAEVRQSRLFYRAATHSLPQDFFSRHYQGNLESIYPLPESDQVTFQFHLTNATLTHQRYSKFYTLLKKFENLPIQKQDRLQLATLYIQGQRYASAEKLIMEDLSRQVTQQGLNRFLVLAIGSGQSERFVDILAKNQWRPKGVNECLYLEALSKTNRRSQTKGLLHRLQLQKTLFLKDCGDYYYRAVSSAQFNLGLFADATPQLEVIYQSSPRDLDVLAMLTSIYFGQPNRVNARPFASYYETVAKEERTRIETLQSYFKSENLMADAEALTPLMLTLTL